MMDDDERANRGRRARAEFNQLEGAFQSVSNGIMAELVKTSPSQPEKILKLHMAVQNLAAVRKALLMVAEDGLIAEAMAELTAD